MADPKAVARHRPAFVKDLRHLVDHNGTNQGGEWWDYKGAITPNDRFFIRNEYPTPRPETDPRVDRKSWRLKIHGDAVEREIILSFDDLLKLKSTDITCVIECAGNGRSLFWEQQGMLAAPTQVKGTGWGFGGIGQAEWRIVPFPVLFGLAGIKKSARDVLLWSGVDGAVAGAASDTGRPVPFTTLADLGDDAGLAFKMNGVDLPADHGAPVRAVVPGWCGAASTKWVTEIKISAHNFWVPLNTKRHVMIGADYAPPTPQPDDEMRFVTASDIRGPAVNWSPARSFLTMPLVLEKQPKFPHNYPLKPGEMPSVTRGRRMLTGYAYAAEHGVSQVHVQLDGKGWIAAQVLPDSEGSAGDKGRYGWRRFQIPWTARPGVHVLETRVTDRSGARQPASVPFNEGGFNFHAIPKFHVRVT